MQFFNNKDYFPFVKIWWVNALFGKNIQSNIFNTFECYRVVHPQPVGSTKVYPKDYDLTVSSDNNNNLTFILKSLEIYRGSQFWFGGTIII